jgi:hypothetical protein
MDDRHFWYITKEHSQVYVREREHEGVGKAHDEM